MKHHNTVFQQLLKVIPRHQFQKVVDRHNGDHRTSKENFILEDQVIRLSSDKGSKDCPVYLRRVTIRREEDGKVVVFISNDLKRTAVKIAALYKSRWQIELFFKWIKQNLKIKRFIVRSENAVKIQVLTAMITYLLLRLAQITTRCQLSLQQIARRIIKLINNLSSIPEDNSVHDRLTIRTNILITKQM